MVWVARAGARGIPALLILTPQFEAILCCACTIGKALEQQECGQMTMTRFLAELWSQET
jgi:hypothetical protein